MKGQSVRVQTTCVTHTHTSMCEYVLLRQGSFTFGKTLPKSFRRGQKGTGCGVYSVIGVKLNRCGCTDQSHTMVTSLPSFTNCSHGWCSLHQLLSLWSSSKLLMLFTPIDLLEQCNISIISYLVLQMFQDFLYHQLTLLSWKINQLRREGSHRLSYC